MKRTLFSTRIKDSTFEQGDLNIVLNDISDFNAAIIKSHALLVLEKDKEEKLEKSNHLLIKSLFKMNDYFANSAVREAKAKYTNVEENHKNHISSKKSAILKIEKKIKKEEKKLKNKEIILNSLISISKAIKNGKKIPKFKSYKGAKEYLKDNESLTFAVRKKGGKENVYNIYTFEVCYLKPLIKKIKHRIKLLKNRLYKENEKLKKLENSKPTACFGSKSLFKKQYTVYKNNHFLWRKQFFNARNRRMTISGRADAAQGNFVFKYDCDNFKLAYTSMNGKEIIFKNVKFPYGQEDLNAAINAKAENRKAIAWSIERHNGYFIIKAIIEVEASKDVNYSKADGIIGMDLNYDHIAWSDVDRHGNLLETKRIDFDLAKLTSNQATYVIERAVIELLSVCVKKNKPLAREDLDIKSKNNSLLYNSTTLNSKLSSFAYDKFAKAIESRALKDKVAVFKVNPAYTSQIGKIKYMKIKGISIHSSASYVVGRRALGFKDTVPDKIKGCIPLTKLSKHNWAHWRFLSTQIKNIEPKYFYKNLGDNLIYNLKDYKAILLK